MQDFEEEGQWCDKKQSVCSATITDMDLRAPTSPQQKHKALEDEMVWRHNRFLLGPLATGQDMSESGLPLADQLQDRVRVVQGKWAMLMKEAAKKRAALEFECNVAVISKEKSDVPLSGTGEKTDPFLAMLPRDQVGIGD